MPGFDRTGPMGMGPMTGGGWGPCGSYGRGLTPQRGFGPWSGWGRGRGRGRGRGFRHMYWATGAPGWMRFGPMGPWGFPSGSPYTREDEVAFLKDQAAALKDELDAIDKRLRDMESEEAPE